MTFHFASSEYAACFLDLPQPDPAQIRKNTLEYLKDFDPNLWYNEPIVSLLKGDKLAGSDPVDTVNALGDTNGRQVMANPEQVNLLKEHICTYKSPYTDLRSKIRTIEEEFLTKYSGFLIGNQCHDFQKQDGVTEIEESIMANKVEQRLNDLLLREEGSGSIVVNRQPIYVSCVSNFTNFLDLFRKTLRSLEVGIPCIILGRSNTSQHPFRWTEKLLELMKAQEIDPGMLTFLSCTLDDIKDITKSCQEHTGKLYSTCSRELAADIKAGYPKAIASTGGPNTLVTTEFTKEVAEAIQMSASIESSGQCTALRLAVVPPSTDTDKVQQVFDGVKHIAQAPEALEKSMFDGVFSQHKGSPQPGDKENYKHHEKVDAYIKVGDDLPAPGINEFWRKVVVDVSRLNVKDDSQLDRLAAWLNENQPISLAVNGPRQEAIQLGLKLFGKTGMVVNTVGSTDSIAEMPPALTCQARPQEAEVFGEFPPRSQLTKYTEFPMIVPSSNPSYDTAYKPEYLQSQTISKFSGKSTKSLLEEVKDGTIGGYCAVLIKYLQDVAKQNPKQGFGKSRTAVWGLQRPPLGTKTIVRCGSGASWDAVAPIYVLFHATNAREQVELSLDPTCKDLIALCDKHQLAHVVETEDTIKGRVSDRKDIFNLVPVSHPMQTFPMAGQFVSLYFPLGHIKSTKPDDEEFVLKARLSEKWLNTLF